MQEISGLSVFKGLKIPGAAYNQGWNRNTFQTSIQSIPSSHGNDKPTEPLYPAESPKSKSRRHAFEVESLDCLCRGSDLRNPIPGGRSWQAKRGEHNYYC